MKQKKVKESKAEVVVPVIVEVSSSGVVPITKVIHPIAIDFPSQQLNDMARKINELIDILN
jgi:hypothetical protein